MKKITTFIRNPFLLEGMLCLITLVTLLFSLMLKIQFIRGYIIVVAERIIARQLDVSYWDNYLLTISWVPFYFIPFVLAFLFFVSSNADKIINMILNRFKWLNPSTIKIVCVVFISYSFILYLNKFILGIDLSVYPPEPHYMWALNKISNARLFLFGGDITYTYGPYGYLLFGLSYIHSFLFGLIVLALNAFLFYLNYHQKNITPKKQMLFFLVLFVFFIISNYKGSISQFIFECSFNLTLFFLFCTFWKIKDNKILFYLFSVISGLLCSFSLLLKFNTGILAFGCASIFGLYILLFHRKSGFKYLLIFTGIYLLVLICNIPYYFNSLNNFITWIIMSIEFTKGYSESMVSIGHKIYLLYMLIILALYLVIFIPAIKTYKTNNGLIFLLLGIVILFFSFKHGFVRQDVHMVSFFYSMPFLFGFLHLFSTIEFNRKILLCFFMTSILSFVAIISIFGIGIFNNPIKHRFYDIVKLNERIKTLDQRKIDALRAYVISSEWNEFIGDNTIQIVPGGQLSYAVANNWQGWVPNPVLQLYAAYTKKLDEYSAFSFSDERAPRYILLEYVAIDNRNMFMDTPETWNSIIYNYEILKSDSSLLLLEKQKNYKTLNLTYMESKTYRFNEEIMVPASDNHIYAKISIKQTFLGKITTTLFRGNPPNLKLQFQDGSESIIRVIPATLNNPVLIDAVPTTFSQMENFFNGIITENYSVKGLVFLNKTSFRFINMFANMIKIDWYYNHVE